MEGGLEVLAVGHTLDGVQLAARLGGDVTLTPRFVLHEQRGRFDVWQAAGGEKVAQALGSELPVDAHAVSDDGAVLAVAYRGTAAIHVWDLARQHQLANLPVGSRPLRIAVAARGDRLAVVHAEPGGGSGGSEPVAYRLEVRALPGGERIAAVSLQALEPVFLRFLPDGERLLLGSGDWRYPAGVHVLDPARADTLVSLNDVGEAQRLRVAPDGRHVAIATSDGVRIWSLETGRATTRLPSSGQVADIAFTPDGRYLAEASGNNDLTLWPWRAQDLLERACGQLTRNLGRGEWQDFLPGVAYRATCADLPADGAIRAEVAGARQASQ